MGKVQRTSISIPPDLKRRMDAVDEPVNWSAVACRAFEDKLAEITTRKGVKEVEDVITRLRASKRRCEDAMYHDGFARGQSWARQSAEADQLERVAEYRRGFDFNTDWDWETFFERATPWRGADHAGWLCAAINPDPDDPKRAPTRDEEHDFWTVAVGDGYGMLVDNPAFLRGFVDGALDVWEQVKDQL